MMTKTREPWNISDVSFSKENGSNLVVTKLCERIIYVNTTFYNTEMQYSQVYIPKTNFTTLNTL